MAMHRKQHLNLHVAFLQRIRNDVPRNVGESEKIGGSSPNDKNHRTCMDCEAKCGYVTRAFLSSEPRVSDERPIGVFANVYPW